MDFNYNAKASQPSHPSGVDDAPAKLSVGEFLKQQRERVAPADDEPAAEAAPEAAAEGGALSYEDEWDKEPGERAAPQSAPPMELQLIDSASGAAYSTEELDVFGGVMSMERIAPEIAQGLVDVFSISAERADFAALDPVRTVSELRAEWGADTEAVLGEIEKFTRARPALSRWLDETGAGNSPAVLRVLGAAASDASLLTKAGAEKFIAALNDNAAYWSGSKLEVTKARLAYAVSGAKSKEKIL